MKRQERVPMIDALRGLSCLGILLYHVRVDLWIGWWRIRSYPDEYSAFAKATAWLSVPTPFLGYAILLFFLISGFCIHLLKYFDSKLATICERFIPCLSNSCAGFKVPIACQLRPKNPAFEETKLRPNSALARSTKGSFGV